MNGHLNSGLTGQERLVTAETTPTWPGRSSATDDIPAAKWFGLNIMDA